MNFMCDCFGIIDGGKIIDIKTLNELIHNDKSNSIEMRNLYNGH